jgi:5-methyltetrahydrofolate--homocysteine methyltransferase
MTPVNLREKTQKQILLLDGAFGTYLASKYKDPVGGDALHGGCMEYLSLSSPDRVSGIHSDYLEAGADAVETNTFGGNALKLSEYGLSADAYEINLASVKLARKEADRYSSPGWPRYVIGSMGPTGKLPSSSNPELGDITYCELKDIFLPQARAILEGGADAILVETGQDMLEMKAAVNAAKTAISEQRRDIVIMAHATLANNGRMLLGTEVSAFMAVMGSLGVDIVGLNCSTGPSEMESSLGFLSANAPCLISCVPNAGLPAEEKGKIVFPLSPNEMAGIMDDLCRKYRIDVIGGCCGTTPGHIRAMRSIIGKYPRRKIPSARHFAGSYRGFDIDAKPRPIKVGERMNTQGSRKMRAMLASADHDGIVELGKAQERKGADLLDLCVALTGHTSEAENAAILTARLAESVEIPLMIDSTDVEVIEKALENYPGTAFINSVNLEDGGEKAERIFSLAKEHGSFVVCLAIDEKGMASGSERKLEVAERIYRMAVEDHSMAPGRLFFDLLTFTLATGEPAYRDSAADTIEAIRALKAKIPGTFTVLGVSNVSFGLSGASRKVLNVVFLDAAVKAGLDMAILNVSEYAAGEDIDIKERLLAEKLISGGGGKALTDLVEHFSSVSPASGASGPGKDAGSLTIEKRILACVLDRDISGILPLVDEALKTYPADFIISDILMEAMKQAGEKLDSGEMVLPYVLQSAEVMKKAIEYLEKSFSGSATPDKGKVVLATVEGDVHDIGKNLVKMLFANNGFLVIDLGKQVPVQKILETAEKEKPDAVGLSALLVSTSRHMKTCVTAMHEAGLDCPLIVGGAPVNEDFAAEIAKVEGNVPYRGGVFYAKDAFSGLRIVKALRKENEKAKMLDEYRKKISERSGKNGRKIIPEKLPKAAKRAGCSYPEPPFYGVRAISRIPADDVMRHLDKRFLFEVSWGAGLKDPDGKKALIKEEYEPVLERLKEDAIRNGWLDLKAVYGYFRCGANRGKLSVLDGDGKKLAIFDLASEGRKTSIADYFNAEDIVAFQAVTIGGEMTKAVGELIDNGDDARAFYLHGLSVNLAEALAAYVHERIRKELKLEPGRGKRYSPGYPLWKDLKDQEKIFELLDITKRIGVSLTKDHQMVPEQSTTALIVHNDKALY